MSSPSAPITSAPDQVTDRAIILVKAAPQLGDKHGETVCTASITWSGTWVRLYPIAFRTLAEAQQFKRWDIVEYQWKKPKDDPRAESRRVQNETLKVVGQLPKGERFGLVDSMVVNSLTAQRAAGLSFAFIRPKIRKFTIEAKSAAELQEEQTRFNIYANQQDFFLKPLVPYKPCPHRFKYDYETADGKRTGTCQDWETEATYFHWVRDYGETEALKHMHQRWGEELPQKGLLFAMGTHSLYPDTWLINGIIQMGELGQLSFGF